MEFSFWFWFLFGAIFSIIGVMFHIRLIGKITNGSFNRNSFLISVAPQAICGILSGFSILIGVFLFIREMI